MHKIIITTKVLLALLICQCYVSGCSSSKKDISNEYNTILNASNTKVLNGKWRLVKFYVSDVSLKNISQELYPTLMIQTEEKKISGRDGCNTFYGELLELNDHSLVISKIAHSKIACKRNVTYDNAYRTFLSQTRTYELTDKRLILFDNDGSKLLEFLRQE